ncbi:Disease resistance protein [Nymphaea thermarum]|nr:Disease resistance protein [Nymphaea thermarum]
MRTQVCEKGEASAPRQKTRFEFDVFLNFRGKDTRNTFTSHLYHALNDKGIRAFSKSYVESKWCLQEITKIAETGRLILPIFYNVNPRDVRNQTGPFSMAHMMNKGLDPDAVQGWKEALKEVAGMSGYTIDSISDHQEEYERHGLLSVPNKVIVVLGMKPMDDVHECISFMQRSQSWRVLLVLDDVANLRQLTEYFSTSRTMKTKPSNFSAAFEGDFPPGNFVELSRKAVSAIGRLPLAFEVLGPLFKGIEDSEEWEKRLDQLKQVQDHNDIYKKLRISYDALQKSEKCIFLDAACFFNDETDIEIASHVWKSHGFAPELDIESLTSKSLIKSNASKKLEMHSLIRDMGKWIVCEEDLLYPHNRSRLWGPVDSLELLLHAKGTDKIEAIGFNLEEGRSPPADLCLKPEAFAKLCNVRLLRMNNANFRFEPDNLRRELEWLERHGCPLKWLIEDISLEKVAVLDLSRSLIFGLTYSKCQPGKKRFEKMKYLNMSGSMTLRTTFDIAHFPNLEKIVLDNCVSLSLHGFGELKKLTHLSMKRCTELKEAKDCRIKRLPEGFGRLVKLRTLSLETSKANYNIKFSSSFCGLCSLEKLTIVGCSGSNEAVPCDDGFLLSLRSLNFKESSLPNLPANMSGFSNLKSFNLHNCEHLVFLPSMPSSLSKLEARFCSSLERISSISNLENLQELVLYRCQKIKEVNGLERLKSLRILNMIGCTGLQLEWKTRLAEVTSS